MSKTVNLTQEAQQDLDRSYGWYERQSRGLGEDFVRCVDAELALISRNPLINQIVFENNVRRGLTNRFPYSIYYVNEEDLITVFAILDQRRNPEEWQNRV